MNAYHSQLQWKNYKKSSKWKGVEPRGQNRPIFWTEWAIFKSMYEGLAFKPCLNHNCMFICFEVMTVQTYYPSTCFDVHDVIIYVACIERWQILIIAHFACFENIFQRLIIDKNCKYASIWKRPQRIKNNDWLSCWVKGRGVVGGNRG